MVHILWLYVILILFFIIIMHYYLLSSVCKNMLSLTFCWGSCGSPQAVAGKKMVSFLFVFSWVVFQLKVALIDTIIHLFSIKVFLFVNLINFMTFMTFIFNFFVIFQLWKWSCIEFRIMDGKIHFVGKMFIWLIFINNFSIFKLLNNSDVTSPSSTETVLFFIAANYPNFSLN